MGVPLIYTNASRGKLGIVNSCMVMGPMAPVNGMYTGISRVPYAGNSDTVIE
ncbi:hypothetical protein DSM43518_05232 [Mycobacterium marinum]|nr:hypothetical protein DSM43518_05232 [Mycobacterium marinum]